ncbi:hypothetical protein HII31_10616 [Pseudocercospora fuligena]|uniref:Uncharacterized protein n=1 Tax=Pseudocercospora fuligena TaxID=685502 RepID=A0A8H6RBR8_9PEZI|nr:hypothetical protein HII31_10616 [Pseudocercospora fuligena]
MPSQYVYVVTRVDYTHYSDYKGRTKKLGAFATVKEANKLAKSHAKQQAAASDGGVDKEVHYGSHDEITIYWRTCESYPERDRFKVEVSAECLPDLPKPVDQNKTEFGQMVSIPAGKLGGLKGGRFLFTGELKYMTRGAAHAAVCAYGGEAVAEPSKTSDPARPLSYQNAFDFVVVGFQDPVNARKSQFANMFGNRKLDERRFFKLLSCGLPVDVNGLNEILKDVIEIEDESEVDNDDSSDELGEWDEAEPDSLDEENSSDESSSDDNEANARPAKRRRH